MHQKVREFLQNSNTPFRILKHKDFGEVKTAEDFARLSGIPSRRIAKTLFVSDKKNKAYGMAILEASKKANLKKIQQILGFSNISFGSLEELSTVTGYEKYGTTAIGTGLPTVIDSSLLTEDKIYTASGTVGEELEVDPEDLKTLTSAMSADISS